MISAINKKHQKHAQTPPAVVAWCLEQLAITEKELAKKNEAGKFKKNIPPVYGLVLCGGNSKRMGTDKSEIRYHGKAQREHVFELLSGFCKHTFISCNTGQAQAISHLPFIEDVLPGLGPAGGILSAFQRHPGVAWLVMACDLPLVQKDTIEYLTRHRNAAKAATAFWDAENKFPEPLISLWEPASYRLFLQFICEGYTCPRKFLIKTGVEMLTAPDTAAFANINTATDYEEAIKALHENKTFKNQTVNNY